MVFARALGSLLVASLITIDGQACTIIGVHQFPPETIVKHAKAIYLAKVERIDVDDSQTYAWTGKVWETLRGPTKQVVTISEVRLLEWYCGAPDRPKQGDDAIIVEYVDGGTMAQRIDMSSEFVRQLRAAALNPQSNNAVDNDAKLPPI